MNTKRVTQPKISNIKNFKLNTIENNDLYELLDSIVRNKWLIIGSMLFLFLLASSYLMFKKPEYQASVLLQVQDKQASLGGNLTPDISRFIGSNSNPNTQISPIEVQKVLVTSRLILEPVIQQLKLYIKVKPNKLPIVHFFLNDLNSAVLKKPLWGLNRYVWGGEKIEIAELNSPDNYQIKLVAGKTGQYKLYTLEGKLLLEGRINQLEQTSSSNKTPQLAIKIKELTANPGTEFFITKMPLSQIENQLAKSLIVQDITSKAHLINRTGILKITAKSPHPKQLIDILNTAAQIVVENDIQFKSEEIEKLYSFLEKRFSITKSELDIARTKLNQYKASSKRESSDTNPIAMSLARDVEVKNQLHLLILAKLEELRLVKAGIVSNIRILSFAQMPEGPIPSHVILILFIALLLGLVISIGVIIIDKIIRQRVEDPYWLEQNSTINNLAIIPYSETQYKNSQAFKKGATRYMPILAEKFPHEIAIESFRSLRTSVQFLLPKNSNNIITMIGISPSIGKSFISINFAYVLADIKRILLIDGDIRKGNLHHYFKNDSTIGLSDVLNGTIGWENSIIKTQHPNLDFLPKGKCPSNPAELLMRIEFEQLLAKASTMYDLVLIDTPPILAATDSALIAKHAGINLLILGAKQHSKQSIEIALKQLYSAGVKLDGSIYNNIQPQSSYYDMHYYSYAYRNDNNSTII